eukprot:gene2231-3173_t
MPLRRMVPPAGRWDVSSLVAAMLVQLVQYALLTLLLGAGSAWAWLPWLALFGRSAADPHATPTWISLQASRLADNTLKNLRPGKLVTAWVRSLAQAACGMPADGILIGADAVVRITASEPVSARDTLLVLLRAARQGLSGDAPLPTAVLTGLAMLKDESAARLAFDGGAGRHRRRRVG